MGLAETAQLGVNLHLGTTGSFKGATAELGALESAASRGTGALVGGLGKAQKAASSFGGAMSHAKGAIGGLLTGPLGVLGLSAGVFSLGTILEKTIGHTTDFAFSVEKLMGLTGGTAEAMSGLLAVFEKFGVDAERTGMIVGFTEKTLGHLQATTAKVAAAGKSAALSQLEQEKLHREALGESTKAISKLITEQKARDALNAKSAQSLNGLQALEKQYGVDLTNNKGKALDFNTILLQVADYYHGNAAAADKAALAAKLFGRGYADLIPILKLGSKGILDAEQAAKDLGLTLTSQNARDLKDYRQNLRELGDAASGLQLQIGLALVPSINEMAKSITSFVRDNRVGIVQFFSDAATNVGKFGNFIAKDVLPPLKQLGSVAKGAWDLIPDPLKQILVGGIIANKAGKFLFDISIKDAAGGAFDLGKSLLGKGGSPANPLFVKDVGGLGGLGGLGGAAGGLGASSGVAGLSTLLPLALPFLALIAAAEIADPNHEKGGPGRAKGIGGGGFLGINVSAPGPKGGGGAGSTGGLSPDERQAMNDAAQKLQDVKDASQGTAVEIIAMGRASRAVTAAHWQQVHALDAQHRALMELAKGIHDRSVAKFGGKGLGSAAESATYQRDILGKAASIERHGKGSVDRLERLKALLHDAKLATDATKLKLSQDITTLSGTIKVQKPPQVSVTVGTNVQVSANSVVAKFTTTRRYGPSDPTNKSGGVAQ